MPQGHRVRERQERGLAEKADDACSGDERIVWKQETVGDTWLRKGGGLVVVLSRKFRLNTHAASVEFSVILRVFTQARHSDEEAPRE